MYKRKFVETSAWAVTAGDLEAEIIISLIINRHVLFSFRAKVANKSFGSRNPIKAILRALESETIGMAKYDKIKERVRELGLWSKL